MVAVKRELIRKLGVSSWCDLGILQDIVGAKSAKMDNLGAVDRVRGEVSRWVVRLAPLFVSGHETIGPQKRLDKAQGLLIGATNLLENIDSRLMRLAPSDTPMHVAEPVRELQRSVRELTELVGEKKRRADGFQKKNGLTDKRWYIHNDED